MQVVPFDPKKINLSEIINFKSNWQNLQHKVNYQREETKINDKRAETLNEEKRTELKYKNKTHNVVMNESTVVVQNKKNQNKLSWNNLFINQTFLLSADRLQAGVPKEWLNRSNNIERPFQAKMVMAKVEAIKRTKLNSCRNIKKKKNGILC